MRPLKLIMTAFGPYAGRQVIDFEKLGGQQLFLICGPTGAGKSTILDAMCYALYGQTSGGDRSGKGLRSDYAGPDVRTEVTFDFAIGEKRYRITRVPEQMRAGKRGAGRLVLQKPESALYDITDGERLLAASGHHAAALSYGDVRPAGGCGGEEGPRPGKGTGGP